MKLVSNWKQAWKWLSLQMIAFAALWETIPLEAKAVLDPSTQSWITLGLLVAAGVGRMIDQGTAQ
jgi:alkylhydroperoxidase/carboxymuconolactone decarboxylase family protein YurZ